MGGIMHKVMRMATCYILLVSVILTHSISFGAEVSDSAEEDQTQHGMVARVKRGACKLYDCIRGNADTCTADEIMAVRAVLIAFVSKYIIVPMYTTFQEREVRVARARRDAQRARYTRSDGSVDLEEVRARETADTYGRRHRSRASDFDDAVTASMASAGARRTASVDTEAKEHLKQRWNEWLRQNDADAIGMNCGGEECFVCMDEEHTDLARVPCSGAAHSEKMCLDCVGTLIANNQRCPLCRLDLVFRVRP